VAIAHGLAPSLVCAAAELFAGFQQDPDDLGEPTPASSKARMHCTSPAKAASASVVMFSVFINFLIVAGYRGF
jgi:hypothetical protein